MSEELVKAALTLDDRLDDIKRAQIWARVEAGIDARTGAERRPRRRVIGAVAAAAAMLAVAVFALRGGRTAEPTALVAPPDTTLSWKIGSHVRASLVGPARLEPVSLGDRAVVRLHSGTLLADFAGGGGRSLEILAPDATIDIVGTLFAVEVGATATCVSVAHGTVRMTSGPRTYTIRDRQRACSDAAAVQSIGLAMQDALARHEAVLTASESRPTPPSPRPPPQTPDRSLAPNPTSTPQNGRDPVATAAAATPSAQVDAVALTDRAPRAAIAPSTASAPRTEPTRVADAAPRVAPARVADAAPRAAPTRPVDVSPPAEPTHTTDTSPRVLPRAEPARAADTAPRAAPARAIDEAQRAEPARAVDPSSRAEREPGRTADVSPRTAAHAEEPSPRTAQPVPASTQLPTPTTTTAGAPVQPQPLDLYREADRALARHDLAAADRSLAALLAQHPASPLLNQALYERARIAVERRAWADARAQLAELARVEHSPLAEPGAYLACTAAPAAEREQCLLVFHARYPQSPHDAHVLGELIQRAFDAGGCAKARTRIGELARAHPDAAQPWRARCPEAP